MFHGEWAKLQCGSGDKEVFEWFATGHSKILYVAAVLYESLLLPGIVQYL